MYVSPNFRSKKALREAVKAGRTVTVYQPGDIFHGRENGQVSVEGPHFPEPHKWYAVVEIRDSLVVRVVN